MTSHGEVDVDDLSGLALEHQVGRVTICEAEDVADHGVHGERTGVCRAALEPVRRVGRLEPEHSIKILTRGTPERILEDFDLL